MWPVLKIIFKLFAGLNVYGLENLKDVKKPVIFASNHESYFDPFLIGSGLPWFSKFHPICYLADDSFLKTISGKLAGFFGGVFSGKLNIGIERAMIKPLSLLWVGKTVGIFHEWCYKKEPLMYRMNKLIPLLSKESMRPVIPVFLYGIENISWKKILKFQKKVSIFYGKPLYFNNNLSEMEMIKKINASLYGVGAQMMEVIQNKEKVFWGNYSKFYHYLEKADPHKELINDFKDSINKVKGTWIDFGSGSGAIASILSEKGNKNNAKIIATDFETKFIEELKNRFNEKGNVQAQFLDLTDKIKFEKNSIDGITANLVLPYIICHDGNFSLKAFKSILREIFEILKPGGIFVWSSPKKNVNFWKVAMSSKKNVFDFRDKKNIYYGMAILKQALKIEKKGRQGIYNFLSKEEIEKILAEIGFVNITHKISMAKQVNIIKCEKPLTLD